MKETYSTYYASPIGNIRITCNRACITEMHFLNKDEQMAVTADIPPLLQQCLDELMEYFQGRRKVFDVPVYQQGTVFQERVWNELSNIPFGKTISYLTLAKRLGDPKAIRAAASTNGKNCIAVIVPCHRVIGSNNDLVGYAGGLWRKKWLLELETKITHGVQTLF
ncbi:MAG: methylated-DNA--[protein]-cysteine S-methyltransferase [Chitinophagaceae bacterium]